MDVDLSLLPQQFDEIDNRDHEIIISGSAGSGKSYFAALKTILYAIDTPKSLILATRKYGPSLMMSCYADIISILDQLSIPYHEKTTQSIIVLFNGSRIMFKSIDILNKFRSTEFDYIWIEQSEEINYYDYQELKRRLRGAVGGDKSKGHYSQAILTATPEDEVHWMHKIFYENELYEPRHFDYKQNIHLPEDYVKDLERLKKIDIELYNKYALGMWGKITNTIYPNWKKCVQMPKLETLFAGVDWGYNNPSAFILMCYAENNIYILDEVYKTQLTNTSFLKYCLAMCKQWGMQPSDMDVWYDPSEPARAEEFSEAGFNMLPGVRDPLARIDTVKSSNVYYTPTVDNVKKELKGYKWQTDKNGNVLDRPIKFNDHTMDAIGYGVQGFFKNIGKISPTDPYLLVGSHGY